MLRQFSFTRIDRKFNLLELSLTWIDGNPVKLNVARDITDHRDPAQRRFAEIRKCALRASALIKQVLAFSRRQILNKKLIDLNSVIIKYH